MAKHDPTSSASKADEQFWRKALLQEGEPGEGAVIDRYRWAMRYEQMARKRHKKNVSFEEVVTELEAAWNQYGGPPGLSWPQAKAALRDSWERTDGLLADTIAGRAGFKRPPTFADHGGCVPRNIDEPNM